MIVAFPGHLLLLFYGDRVYTRGKLLGHLLVLEQFIQIVNHCLMIVYAFNCTSACMTRYWSNHG